MRIAAIEKKTAEDRERPAQVVNQGGTRGDEGAPQHERACHAREQDPVLAGGRHGEGLEEHGEDEQVVDAQRLLDEIGGKVLLPRIEALPQDENQAEPDPGAHPRHAEHHGPGHARLAPGGDHVDGQQATDHGHSRPPRPRPERWSSAAAAMPVGFAAAREQDIADHRDAGPKISHGASASRSPVATSSPPSPCISPRLVIPRTPQRSARRVKPMWGRCEAAAADLHPVTTGARIPAATVLAWLG